MRQTTTIVEGIIVSETRYTATGMVEISYSIPELVKGAGNILQAVVSKYDPRGPWVVSTREANRAHIGRIRRHATEYALIFAKHEMHKVAHLYKQ